MSSVTFPEESSTGKTLSGNEYRETRGVGSLGSEHLLSSASFEYTLPSSQRPFSAGRREEAIAEAKRRLYSLLSLREPNWDSYGALPISETAVDRAARVIQALLEDNLPAPYIFPLTDGGVRLEWMDEAHEFSLDIYGSGDPLVYLCIEAEGEEWEGDLADATFDLPRVLNRLAASRPAPSE